MLFLAFPASNLHYLAWIALVPLWIQIRRLSTRESVGQCFVGGFVFQLLTLQWLATNIYWAGGWALWGYVLVCAILASFWSLLALLWKCSTARNPSFGVILPFVVLWGGMEFVISFIFTGFGWTALAHSQSYNNLAFQWGAFGGFTLIGMLIVLINALIGEAIVDQPKRIKLLLASVLTLGIVHGGGYMMLRPATFSASPLHVGIYQSNTPLQTKWDPEYKDELVREAVIKSRILAEYEHVDLFVWPEALILTDINTDPTRNLLLSLVQDSQTDLFAGAQRTDGFHYYNSSYFVAPGSGFTKYYDKMHLAPYGEYVPFSEYLPFLSRIIPSVSDQTPGETTKTFSTHERTLGPLICFEVLFSPMSQNLLEDGADFIVVVTNLGWFGSSNALPQELAIAKLRAVETRLPVVQASNTGISGIIDPWGRLTGLDRYIDKNGNNFSIRPELTPEQTVNMRLAGAIPLPDPARQPIPFGPKYWPYIVSVACVATILTALLKPKPSDEHPKKR